MTKYNEGKKLVLQKYPAIKTTLEEKKLDDDKMIKGLIKTDGADAIVFNPTEEAVDKKLKEHPDTEIDDMLPTVILSYSSLNTIDSFFVQDSSTAHIGKMSSLKPDVVYLLIGSLIGTHICSYEQNYFSVIRIDDLVKACKDGSNETGSPEARMNLGLVEAAIENLQDNIFTKEAQIEVFQAIERAKYFDKKNKQIDEMYQRFNKLDLYKEAAKTAWDKETDKEIDVENGGEPTE